MTDKYLSCPGPGPLPPFYSVVISLPTLPSESGAMDPRVPAHGMADTPDLG